MSNTALSFDMAKSKRNTRIKSGYYRQSDDRKGENSKGKANLKRWVLSFERNVETDNELRVSARWELL